MGFWGVVGLTYLTSGIIFLALTILFYFVKLFIPSLSLAPLRTVVVLGMLGWHRLTHPSN